MKKSFWKKENIYVFLPILFNLITLLVFIYQTSLIQRQQFRSVYPHLQLSNKGSGSLEYQYLLTNMGIGPAFITKVAVRDTNDNEYESISDYLATKITIEDSIWIYNSDLYAGRLIPANQVIPLYGLHTEEDCKEMGLPPNTFAGANKLRSIINNDELIVEITYESIYGESWMIDNFTVLPQKK